MADGREIGAYNLSPRMIARLLRGPGTVGDIGRLVDGHALLRAKVIFRRGRIGPDNPVGIILLIESVGALQVVMRVLEAQLDQVPPRRVGPIQIVDGILRHPIVVEAVILAAIVIGMVHARDPRPLVEVFLDLGSPPRILCLRLFMKEDTRIFMGHGFVVAVDLARRERTEPVAAQIVLPARRWRQDIAPKPVEIDQPRAKR